MRTSTTLTASTLLAFAAISSAAPVISEGGAALLERDPKFKLPHFSPKTVGTAAQGADAALQLSQFLNLTRRGLELLAERESEFKIPSGILGDIGHGLDFGQDVSSLFNFSLRDTELLEREPTVKLPKLPPGTATAAAHVGELGFDFGQLLNLTRRGLELLEREPKFKLPKISPTTIGHVAQGADVGLQIGQLLNLTRRSVELLEREPKIKLPKLPKLPPGTGSALGHLAGLGFDAGQLLGSHDSASGSTDPATADTPDASATDGNATDATQPQRRHMVRRRSLKSRMAALDINELD
ncbi:hypothetical protein EVG20_g3611 [Dentipellis fragilis]|uniref:Uncharacterized protein n=1 Tax=Dentipellis fragilis TaxID=205917 RepID=A0A4Y9Z0H6_9AGAM|nr:hypothetical protein EVG20_g3611 [Dentipellis fragilis]